MRWLTRSLQPPDITPNDNDPADVPPATVGPNVATPGDPNGVEITGPTTLDSGLPPIWPSAWSGWPADWWPPMWGGKVTQLTDTAWACLDLNSSVLATMPPYLVGAAESLDTAWFTNPDPDVYSSWEEFAKQLFWDYQLGEAFILATARYATGFPARFHVLPPWTVNAELRDGVRSYSVGAVDITADVLHVRYASSVDDARGHGPLEAGRARLVAAGVLSRYAQNFAGAGGVPTSILKHPEDLTTDQAAELKREWVAARQSGLGEPAVLSGGIEWEGVQLNPKDMALVELSQLTDSRIAVLLGVPPFLVGLPSGGDPMTYQNVAALFDYHWRAGLRPKAQTVMAALSEWLLPRGTSVELNRDAYVQPEPESRARTAQILNNIRDDQGNPALTVDEIRSAERLKVAGADGIVPPEVTASE
ncbi:MAG: phage portal protein [Candidatus Dormibacteraeota bacterium]|nr:phage portal protein [Candidatus Dormibacteraeota bacterium]